MGRQHKRGQWRKEATGGPCKHYWRRSGQPLAQGRAVNPENGKVETYIDSPQRCHLCGATRVERVFLLPVNWFWAKLAGRGRDLS